VATEILDRKSLQERALALQQFIVIATECLKLHNFHTMFAIVAALQSHPVFRLKELKGVLDTYHQRMLDQILKITSSDDNYKAYRPMYKRCLEAPVPCLPHLALAFKDLFLYEEISAYERQHNVVDFYRIQRVAHEIAQLLSLAKRDYTSISVKSNPHLRDRLRLVMSKAKDSEQLLERSLQLEPKRSWQQHREHVQQQAINVLLEEGFL